MKWILLVSICGIHEENSIFWVVYDLCLITINAA